MEIMHLWSEFSQALALRDATGVAEGHTKIQEHYSVRPLDYFYRSARPYIGPLFAVLDEHGFC